MSGSEILDGWQGKNVRVQLSSGGAVEGTLLRTDAIGGLFEMDTLTLATPAGPIESEATQDSTTAYCFVPWAEVKMIIPVPGELP